MAARFFDPFHHMTMVLGPSDPTAVVRIGLACKVDVLRGLEGTLHSLGISEGRPRGLLRLDATQKAALTSAWFRRYRSTPDALLQPWGTGWVVLRTPLDLDDMELVHLSDASIAGLPELVMRLIDEFHAATGRYDTDDEDLRAA